MDASASPSSKSTRRLPGCRQGGFTQSWSPLGTERESVIDCTTDGRMARGGNQKKSRKKIWNQMVKGHSSPRRLSRDSILLAVHPALGLASRVPRIPPAARRPPSPAAPGRLAGSLRPRAERRAERGGQGRGGGARLGRGGGGSPGGGKRGKARGAEKKTRGWRKSAGPRSETS